MDRITRGTLAIALIVAIALELLLTATNAPNLLAPLSIVVAAEVAAILIVLRKE